MQTAPSEIISGLVERRQGRAEDREVQELRTAHEVVRAGHHASSVRTNADTPEQTANAIAFGAIGIGLTRTEHMFFEGDRIDAMREMILADNARRPRKPPSPSSCRTSAKTSSASSRRSRAYPATIRFLDPAAPRVPPARRRSRRMTSRRRLGVQRREDHAARATSCTSSTRCSVTAAAVSASRIPEITEMQARAVFEAAADVPKKTASRSSPKS